MISKGLRTLGKSALPLALATVILAGTSVALTSTTAATATSASSSSGVWPGVGKICEPGPGGASTVRGVGYKTINIAVFNDASNTIDPGLEAEFPQQATAFADWCNAAGGINGRKIVIDNRDAALFNAAQQTTAACQSDFMAVGGGMALDQPSVPIREKCGLGQISGYVVSNASELATDQVDPTGTNTDSVTSGWFRALGQGLPEGGPGGRHGRVRHPFGPPTRNEVRVRRRGAGLESRQTSWNPRLRWRTGRPTSSSTSRRGSQALWPADNANFTPFAQAMTTAGYHPAFVVLGAQFANSQTQQAVAANPSLPPVYVETQWWPLAIASQNPSTEELVTIMHKYAKGDDDRLRRRGGGGVMAPVGQGGLGLRRRQPHGDLRTEPRRRHDELGRRGH